MEERKKTNWVKGSRGRFAGSTPVGVRLSKGEYRKIVSEINTNYGKYAGKKYTIMSPEGQEYTVTNLMNWIRENIHLFGEENSDEAVNRVAHGFYTVTRNTRLNKRGQRYKGWIVVEHDERKNVEKK